MMKKKSSFRIASDHAAQVIVIGIGILGPMVSKLFQLVLGDPFKAVMFLFSTPGQIALAGYHAVSVVLGVFISVYWMKKSGKYFIEDKEKVVLVSSVIFFVVEMLIPIGISFVLFRVISFTFISWGTLELVFLTAVFYLSSRFFIKETVSDGTVNDGATA